MPEEGVSLTPNPLLLTSNEIQQISSFFVKKCGIKKIRLTGGEPLVRKDVIDIVQNLSDLRNYGLETIAMTTNGLTLKKKLKHLKNAGTVFGKFFPFI